MGIYGFCMLLKQLNNHNSRRGTTSKSTNHTTLSQTFSITGFSLISQSILTASHLNNPQRHLDTLTLEIIGILRKSFNQTKEIKQILYESLHRVIEYNTQVISHILQFLDMHFRSHFDIDELNIEIHFNMIMREKEK